MVMRRDDTPDVPAAGWRGETRRVACVRSAGLVVGGEGASAGAQRNSLLSRVYTRGCGFPREAAATLGGRCKLKLKAKLETSRLEIQF